MKKTTRVIKKKEKKLHNLYVSYLQKLLMIHFIFLYFTKKYKSRT